MPMDLARLRSFVFFFVYLVSIFSLTNGRQLASEKPGGNYEVLKVEGTSPSPSDTCNTSIRESGQDTILKLVHKRGPCSNLNLGGKTPMAVLLQDQARVKMIQETLGKSARTGSQIGKASIDLPLNDGDIYNTGNYIVQMSLGTPPVVQSLTFDTGSRTTWVQCIPCANCHYQQDPFFVPANSSTFTHLPCGSSACTSSPFTNCAGGLCRYRITYGDGTNVTGVLSSDTLTLSKTDVVPNFAFGCNNYINGLFGEEAGLIGFSRAPLSFVSQTVSIYGGFFSYCLPSSGSSTGFLSLGVRKNSTTQLPTYVPLSASASFYLIELTGISVGGKPLALPLSSVTPEAMTVDSGSVLTYLSRQTYNGVRDEFLKQMTDYSRAPSPLSLLDTCFDLTGFSTVSYPRIVFTFNDQLQVSFPGTLVNLGNFVYCLGYSPSSVSILGNRQQKTTEVIFDTTGKRLGFLAGACG